MEVIGGGDMARDSELPVDNCLIENKNYLSELKIIYEFPHTTIIQSIKNR